MAYRYVKYEVSDGIALVTMDNPPVNATTLEGYHELTDVFDDITDREQDISVAVLTGAGDRAFCAGRDVRDASIVSPRKRQRGGRELMWAILECEVPVIAAVQGWCLGAGTAMASVCDIVLASQTAIFGLPEVNVGALGGYKFAARVMGEQKARELLFTADRIDAQEAYRLGFVNKVVPKDQLMDEAMQMAGVIAAKSRVVIREAKKSIIYSEFLNLKEGYRKEQNFTMALTKTEDAKEAASAFMEKRKPVFRGR